MLGQRFKWTSRFQVIAGSRKRKSVFFKWSEYFLVCRETYRFLSYFSIIRSRCSSVCTRLGSQRPSHVFAHSSLPCVLINSISSLEKVAIDIDLTRCGGVMPRLNRYKKMYINKRLTKYNLYMFSHNLKITIIYFQKGNKSNNNYVYVHNK